jgi:hypothetical protein
MLTTLQIKIRNTIQLLRRWGGPSFLAGIAMATCFTALTTYPSLRGSYVIPFFGYFSLASFAYLLAVGRLGRDRTPLSVIWGFAILFRLLLLFTAPTLSDDIFRYLWDGRLLSQGINPYAFAVNDPALDTYAIPARAFVNHDWMASPYLPAAQLYFGLVYKIFPGRVLAFQVGSMLLDLGAGWLVMDMLRLLGLPHRRALVYLWSPLVVIEFAHGAHADALMIFLIVLAFWCLVRMVKAPGGIWWSVASALALAAATLTKGFPALLAPLFLRRWGWRELGVYLLAVITPLSIFALGAGWGFSGPPDGTGLFGALRIYMRQWNYNAGLYHYLEVYLTGVRTQGAVPLGPDTEEAIRLAKLISGGLMGLVMLGLTYWAWRWDKPRAGSDSEPRNGRTTADSTRRTLGLLRLAVAPLGFFLMLTTTVHPWYVAMIMPFLPFLLPGDGDDLPLWRFIWPWAWFSCAVGLSYLTYVDPLEFHEFAFVRRLEYFPFYLLLIWAAWPFLRRGVSRIVFLRHAT